MSDTWRLFKNLHTPVSTAEGLGVDDTLPHSVANNQSPPILHLYTFVPSAIVGKYQDINASLKLDRCRARGIETNRRSTGGGTVIMGPEIVALGLGIPVKYPGLKSGVGGLFESISHILIMALEKIGIRAMFRPKNDLEIKGKKIAGLSAATENGKSLLFHTSLLDNFDLLLMLDIMNTPLMKLRDKGYNCFSQRMTTVNTEIGREVPVKVVMDTIQEAFEEGFRIRFVEDRPDRWERESITHFIKDRYTNPDWIFSHKHPRARMGIGRVKTEGGLLEIYLSLSGGSIENVIITGDFFSTGEDISRLERALKWTSARKERIEETLAGVWREGMIHGVDLSSIATAILRAKENQVRL